MKPIIQSAINISTSDSKVVRDMVNRLSLIPGLIMADASSDVDHNRTVISLLGNEKSLPGGVRVIFEIALQTIDISHHQGEHPRMGAVDVVPFTPWGGVTMEECRKLAWKVGGMVSANFQIPVFFYGEAAKNPAHRDLSFVRRGGYEKLREEIQTVPERKPDLGPNAVHPTLGAVAIGARIPLVAFNVNLKTPDKEIANRIAWKMRGENGGLRWVKAIAIQLRSQNQVQVSMNLLDYTRSTLYQAYEMVKVEAHRFGIEISGSELIGLAPLDALVDTVGFYLQIPGLKVSQVLESHLTDDEPEDQEGC